MADFADIQAQLHNDPALAKRFLSDPVGVLHQHGVQLSPQQTFNLHKAVAEVTRPGAPTQAALLPNIRVFIGIRIDLA
jgi:hypothetical protein